MPSRVNPNKILVVGSGAPVVSQLKEDIAALSKEISEKNSARKDTVKQKEEELQKGNLPPIIMT